MTGADFQPCPTTGNRVEAGTIGNWDYVSVAGPETHSRECHVNISAGHASEHITYDRDAQRFRSDSPGLWDLGSSPGDAATLVADWAAAYIIDHSKHRARKRDYMAYYLWYSLVGGLGQRLADLLLYR